MHPAHFKDVLHYYPHADHCGADKSVCQTGNEYRMLPEMVAYNRRRDLGIPWLYYFDANQSLAIFNGLLVY